MLALQLSIRSLLDSLRQLAGRDDTRWVKSITVKVFAQILNFILVVGSLAGCARATDKASGTSVACLRVWLCLLARDLHQTERIEVCVGLLRVRVHMDLRIRRFAYELLRPDHHSALHAGVGDIWDHIEDNECLLEFNNLLIACVLSEMILLRDYGRSLDSMLLWWCLFSTFGCKNGLCKCFINFLEFICLNWL